MAASPYIADEPPAEAYVVLRSTSLDRSRLTVDAALGTPITPTSVSRVPSGARRSFAYPVSGGRSTQSCQPDQRLFSGGKYGNRPHNVAPCDRHSRSATVLSPQALGYPRLCRHAGKRRRWWYSGVSTRTVNGMHPSMDKAGTAVAARPLTPRGASTQAQGTTRDPTAR